MEDNLCNTLYHYFDVAVDESERLIRLDASSNMQVQHGAMQAPGYDYNPDTYAPS
jgi:hypothetical protein